MRFKFGWDNGKLEIEKKPLSKKAQKLLDEIKETTYCEMGERTRRGSGDDQTYVDGMYEQIKKDRSSNLIIEIVFRLLTDKSLDNETPKNRAERKRRILWMLKNGNVVKKCKCCAWIRKEARRLGVDYKKYEIPAKNRAESNHPSEGGYVYTAGVKK